MFYLILYDVADIKLFVQKEFDHYISHGCRSQRRKTIYKKQHENNECE